MRLPILFWVGTGLWLLPATGRAVTVADPTLPPAVAATVNAEPIPRQLVEAFLKNDRESLALDPATDDGRRTLAELPAHILDELVDRQLIGQGARERGVGPSAADLDAAERETITFCGNEARYAVFLKQNGFTREDYRTRVLLTKLNGQALTGALTRGLAVPPDEMRAYYDAHAGDADFQWPERVRGAHILVEGRPGVLTGALEERDGLQPGSPEMTAALDRETERRRQLAESIREKAAAPGADFAALAKQYSEDAGTREQGGSLGIFARGVHPEGLDDAFFQLAAGQVGPVVRTEYGFHVIRAAERLPAGRRTFEEAAPEIRRRLSRQQSARVMQDWLTQARATARIVVHDAADLPGR